MGISTLLEGNDRFVNGKFAQQKKEFEDLLKGQNPHTLVISCCDSRTAPEMVFSCEPGEIFVHRNIGNMAAPGDWNLGTVLEYGIRHLKIQTIVINGHEKCGAMKALGTGGGEGDDFIPGWLTHSKAALERLEARIKKPGPGESMDAWLCELEKENIRLQLEHLKTYPVVAEGLKSKNLEIFGLYWLMSTGKVEKIE